MKMSLIQKCQWAVIVLLVIACGILSVTVDHRPDGIPGDATQARIAENGKVIAFLSRGKMVVMQGGKVVGSVPMEANANPKLKMSNDGERLLAYNRGEEKVLLWNTKRWEEIPMTVEAPLSSCDFLGNDEVIAITMDDQVHIYNSKTGVFIKNAQVASR